MKCARTLVVLAVLVFPAMLFADVVHLRDGSTHEGRVVSQTPDVVVIEIVTGNVRGHITIPRGDVDRIERKRTAQQTLSDQYAQRRKELNTDNAGAVIALAAWAKSNRLYAEAEALLSDLAASGERHFDRAMLELARMAYDRNLDADASRYANAVLEHHPDHAEAKALMAQIARDEEKRQERLLVEAIRAFNAGSYETVGNRIDELRAEATAERVRTLVANNRLPAGDSLAAFAAEARLRQVEKKGGELGTVPPWQREAMVALLKQRMERGAKTFQEQSKRLLATRDAEGVDDALIERVELAAASTMHWIAELEALQNTPLRQARDAVATVLQKVYAHAGALHADRAASTWRKVQAAGGSMLAHHETLRTIAEESRRAEELLLLADVDRAGIEELRRLQDDVAGVLAHNERLAAAYGRVRRALGDKRTIVVTADREPGNPAALKALQEIVDNASEADLDYISGRLQREYGRDLRELMTDCRRPAAEGGYADVYGEDEPVERLLAEADGHAWEACKTHRVMWRFKEAGKSEEFPIILIKRARDHAKEAMRLYHAVLDGPDPVTFTQRQEIFRQLELMADVISGTWEWHKKDGVNPRPEPYR